MTDESGNSIVALAADGADSTGEPAQGVSADEVVEEDAEQAALADDEEDEFDDDEDEFDDDDDEFDDEFDDEEDD